MVAKVTEIQVGGGKVAKTLEEACREYVRISEDEQGFRPKINFAIRCPDGKTRTITIRDEDSSTIAYGDFVGLPSYLEYASELSFQWEGMGQGKE